MVMFAEDTEADRASGMLKKMAKDLRNTGLTIVGQVPDLGIYQFEIENNATDPQEAIALLGRLLKDCTTE
jgi:hypothetical protein